METKRARASGSGTVRSTGETNGRKILQKQLEEECKKEQAEVGLRQLADANAAGDSACEIPVNKGILELAHMAVNGDRMDNYGSQLENFTRIADMWTVILKDSLIFPISPQDVAMCMMALKLARLTKTAGRHRDSIIDVAGYAECLDKVNIGSNKL